jgi:threonine dehydrogenase-like Zn-dependent dehydrogenase
MYGAGEVRVENVPDPKLRDATDAVVRVLRSYVRGSALGVVRDGGVVRRLSVSQYAEVPRP